MRTLWILLILSVIFLVGCTQTNVSAKAVYELVQTIPEVNQFLEDNPDVSFTVNFWSSDEVTQNFLEISSDCGKRIEIRDLYKVDVQSSSSNIVLWVDPENMRVLCGYKKSDATSDIQQLEIEQVEDTNCGNGQIDPDEECDGTNIASTDCTYFGYARGEISCSQCKLDDSLCEIQLTDGSYVTLQEYSEMLGLENSNVDQGIRGVSYSYDTYRISAYDKGEETAISYEYFIDGIKVYPETENIDDKEAIIVSIKHEIGETITMVFVQNDGTRNEVDFNVSGLGEATTGSTSSDESDTTPKYNQGFRKVEALTNTQGFQIKFYDDGEINALDYFYFVDNNRVRPETENTDDKSNILAVFDEKLGDSVTISFVQQDLSVSNMTMIISSSSSSNTQTQETEQTYNFNQGINTVTYDQETNIIELEFFDDGQDKAIDYTYFVDNIRVRPKTESTQNPSQIIATLEQEIGNEIIITFLQENLETQNVSYNTQAIPGQTSQDSTSEQITSQNVEQGISEFAYFGSGLYVTLYDTGSVMADKYFFKFDGTYKTPSSIDTSNPQAISVQFSPEVYADSLVVIFQSSLGNQTATKDLSAYNIPSTICGNGVVESGEGCETLSDCSSNEYCLACSCVQSSTTPIINSISYSETQPTMTVTVSDYNGYSASSIDFSVDSEPILILEQTGNSYTLGKYHGSELKAQFNYDNGQKTVTYDISSLTGCNPQSIVLSDAFIPFIDDVEQTLSIKKRYCGAGFTGALTTVYTCSLNVTYETQSDFTYDDQIRAETRDPFTLNGLDSDSIFEAYGYQFILKTQDTALFFPNTC